MRNEGCCNRFQEFAGRGPWPVFAGGPDGACQRRRPGRGCLRQGIRADPRRQSDGVFARLCQVWPGRSAAPECPDCRVCGPGAGVLGREIQRDEVCHRPVQEDGGAGKGVLLAAGWIYSFAVNMKLNYRISQSKKGQPPGKSRQPTPFGPSRPPFRARVHIAFSVKLWYACPKQEGGASSERREAHERNRYHRATYARDCCCFAGLRPKEIAAP